MNAWVFGWRWCFVGGVIPTLLLYLVNRWLNIPISSVQMTVLVLLYLFQYGVALLGIHALYQRRWAVGASLLLLQLMTVEHVAHHAVYRVLPKQGEALHHANVPFIDTQFKRRVMSGYTFVMALAGGFYAVSRNKFLRKQVDAYRQEMDEALMVLHEEEAKNGQALMSSHFLRSMVVTVSEYAKREPGERAAQAAQAFIELVEYAIKGSRRVDSVDAASEWHQVENLALLANIKVGREHVVLSSNPRYAWALHIPPFAWLTLVENALMHGDLSANAMIQVRLTHESGATRFSCRNREGEGVPRHQQGGQGLRMLRERMQKVFGEGAALCIREENGYYHAILTIDDS